MLKQALSQTCVCGQPITFPEGEIRTKCSCGANWECGEEGFWHVKENAIAFAPILPKPVICSVKSRAERYRNYPNSKRKRKGKAGTR